MSALWQMRNGYALCTDDGLDAISALLSDGGEELRDTLRGQLAIGLHRNVQVTDIAGEPRRHRPVFGKSASGRRPMH